MPNALRTTVISVASVPKTIPTLATPAGPVKRRSRAQEVGAQLLGKTATSAVGSLLGAEVAKVAKTF